MKHRIALLLVAALAGLGGLTGGPSAAVATGAPTATAKSCSAGYTHAAISWGHKCLKAGQFCKRAGDREYHRYGYHCHRFDRSVARYRLTR